MQNSTSTSGRRLAAAMFLGATSAALVAGTAHADGVTGATVDDNYKDKGIAHMSSDTKPHETAHTALIGLLPHGGGSELWTYCIQATVDLQTSQKYDEKDWSDESKITGIDAPHLQAIKWILNNSVPALTPAQLATNAKVKGGLKEEEAVAGTQAAIWSFSDAKGHMHLDATAQDSDDPNITTIYNYLVQAATGHMNDPDQPKPSLGLTPLQSGAVKPGDKVGFKVMSSDTTDPFTVTLADNAAGAKLVGADGKPLPANATFKAGDTVYVQLPATPAKGSVTLKASGTVTDIEAGRVFINENSKTVKSQNLILAQSENAPVSASAAVSWEAPAPPTSPSSTPPSTTPSSHPSTPSTTPSTPSTTPTTPTASTTTTSPGGNLAHTGAGNTMAIGGGALALVAAGGGMVVYTRRKKTGQGSHS